MHKNVVRVRRTITQVTAIMGVPFQTTFLKGTCLC